MTTTHLHASATAEKVLAGAGPVQVDLRADWRQRCHAMNPVLKRLA